MAGPFCGTLMAEFGGKAIRTRDMSMADVFADPHYRAREMIVDVPAEGLGVLPQPAVVPRLSRTPGRITHAGAALGRDTDDVLSGLLGLTGEQIAALRAEGVV